MSNAVIIRELAPREGFQILQTIVPTSEKLRLIRALALAKVDEIEVTSFVRPDRVPQLADCEDVITQLGAPPSGVVYRALCLNAKGYARSLPFKNLAHPAWFYTGASDTFLQKNANATFAQQLDTIATEWGTLWRANGISEVSVMISNAFGCSYEGEISAELVVQRWHTLQHALISAGFRVIELSLADTVGHGTAQSTLTLIELLRTAGAPTISLHMHDTRGHALECIEAGLATGVRIFESSVAGLGGCPFTAGAAGNIATESVIALCERLGFQTNVDSAALVVAADIARELAT